MTTNDTPKGEDLADSQWYDIASAHALREWNGDGFLDSIKAVGRAAIMADRERLAVAAPVARPDWPASWLLDGYNGCMSSAIEALRYLADNDRPSGGSSKFNSEHLFQIAGELGTTREKLLPAPATVAVASEPVASPECDVCGLVPSAHDPIEHWCCNQSFTYPQKREVEVGIQLSMEDGRFIMRFPESIDGLAMTQEEAADLAGRIAKGLSATRATPAPTAEASATPAPTAAPLGVPAEARAVLIEFDRKLAELWGHTEQPYAEAYGWVRAAWKAALATPAVPAEAGEVARRLKGLLGVVRTAQAEAKRVLDADVDAGDLSQTRRDLPITLDVIRHAVESIAVAASSAAEPSGEERELKGTFACPICGQDTPHGHSDEAVAAYRDDQVRRDGFTSCAVKNPSDSGWYLCTGVEIPSKEGDTQRWWFKWVREYMQGYGLDTDIPEVLYWSANEHRWFLRNALGNAIVSGAENRRPVGAIVQRWRDIESLPTTLKAAPEAVPVDVTEAMVEAYLTANDAYWRRTDALPQRPGVWRTGTPSEATRESLRAALTAKHDTTPQALKAGDAPETVSEDARMLDWLETQKEAYGFADVHEGNRWMIDGPFRTLREAIRAAMSAAGDAS